MKLKISDKLFQEAGRPEGMLYRLIIFYVSCVVLLIFHQPLLMGNPHRLHFISSLT